MSSSSSYKYTSYTYDTYKGIVNVTVDKSTTSNYGGSINYHYYNSSSYSFNPVRVDNNYKVSGIGNYYG
jgi:hypothetical protein